MSKSARALRAKAGSRCDVRAGWSGHRQRGDRDPDPSRVFLGLNDLLDDGNLCYPNEVLEELERTAKNEQPLVWARGCAGNRPRKGAPYNYIIWVTHSCRDLVDETARDTQESGAVYVIAQALEFRDAKVDVSVVSEDFRAKPTRGSVHHACAHFGLRCLRLMEFLDEVELLEDGDTSEVEDESDLDDV